MCACYFNYINAALPIRLLKLITSIDFEFKKPAKGKSSVSTKNSLFG